MYTQIPGTLKIAFSSVFDKGVPTKIAVGLPHVTVGVWRTTGAGVGGVTTGAGVGVGVGAGAGGATTVAAATTNDPLTYVKV